MCIRDSLGAQAVIACTQSGATARAISKYRPSAPVIAATSCEKTATSLALYLSLIHIQLGKSLFIIQKNGEAIQPIKEVLVAQLPSFNDREKFGQTLNRIDNWIKLNK